MKSNFCSRELQEEKKNVTTILEAIKNNSNQRNTLKCPFPLERAIKYFGGKQEKNKQWHTKQFVHSSNTNFTQQFIRLKFKGFNPKEHFEWPFGVGGGMYDEIKLVQFFMKVNAYNLKYSQANSEENGSAKSTH